MPIFQSAMFEYDGAEGHRGLRYIRMSNTPNHDAVHAKLAALERAEDAVVTASGMAATAAALMTTLSAGDHLLVQDCLYGGTRDFVVGVLPTIGVSYDFFDPCAPESWCPLLKSTTRVIYVEAMSNPLLEVGEMEALVQFARSNALTTIIDNTFATPVNFCPAEWGFDLSIHSCTKYLNGHSDLVAGACIGRTDLIAKIRRTLERFGGSLDPHAVSLLNRGLKTLALRVNYQNTAALTLAQVLQRHPTVKTVHYPGLVGHASYERARRWLKGCGGVLSFELRAGGEAAQRLLHSLELAIVAPSLGSVETLVCRPSVLTHSLLSSEERLRLGITDGLVRVSVGIEAIDDVIADFSQALEFAAAA
jgi:cystathionine beta-lyase/cystathionine gamma-synthase